MNYEYDLQLNFNINPLVFKLIFDLHIIWLPFFIFNEVKFIKIARMNRTHHVTLYNYLIIFINPSLISIKKLYFTY